MLLEDFSDCALDEVRALDFKGQWANFFPQQKFEYVDLEIGTGNGLHFAHRSLSHPERLMLGIEIKFKPLIQTIRRARLYAEKQNAVMMRFNAYQIENLFQDNEINNIYIHHPDPWPKQKHWKHRLIQTEYLERLHKIQKVGSFIDFKTDSKCYFDWATEIFKSSPYKVTKYTTDLHHSEFAKDNFVTHFEKIFLKKGQPIFYAQLTK